MSDKFNENLREARKRAGKTQQQVADAIGIAKSTYCQYETGASEPNVLRMIAIAKFLGVTGNELLGLGPPEKTRFDELQRKYGIKRLLAYMEALDRLNEDKK